jgi:hypothetical protein
MLETMPFLKLRCRFLVPVVCAAVALVGCGSSHHKVASSGSAPAQHLPFRFFSARSFWNQQVSPNTAIDPDSARMVAGLSAEVHREEVRGSGPWIDVTTDGVPVEQVPDNQPTVPVKLNHAPDAALTAAWRSVPLPNTAQPSGGDHDLAVYQPGTNRMWEFFQLHHVGGTWEAEWGGAMKDVSSNPGVYGPDAWPGAEPYWGVTAGSLPLVGGAMTVSQLQAGDIDHALALAIPDTRAGVYASPAERSDGVIGSPDAIPEGARLRLDPDLNIASLHLPPLVRLMAEAAQRYGIVVRDTAGIVSFIAEDPVDRNFTVYRRLARGLYPNKLLAMFPWSRLQVVKMDLHSVQ